MNTAIGPASNKVESGYCISAKENLDMTVNNKALNREIAQLLAKGMWVLTRMKALHLAQDLWGALEADQSLRLAHQSVFHLEAIDRDGPICIHSLEEIERVYEEILDFNDRITAGLISPDSIHIITINSEEKDRWNWGLPTLALIGDWAPVESVEPDETLAASLVENTEADENSAQGNVSEPPVIRFLNNTEGLDIQAEARCLPDGTADMYEQIMEGLTRPLTRWLPNEESVKKVEALKLDMPHLSEFLDEVLIAMKLTIQFNASRFTLPPMILNGPPGVGKTYGLFVLAEALGLSMESLPMSTTGAGFILTGCERAWRDPEPGLLAKSAAKSKHINPIFILDEFEKAQFKRDYGMSGLEAAVLQMLERDSAQRLRDVFLEQDLNLSEVSYIGSSNSIHQIPAPILSRIKVIEVGYPPADSIRQLYTSILNRALKEDLGIEGITVSVSGDFNEHMIAGISPRMVRNYARRILCSALTSAKSGDCVEIHRNALLSHIQCPVTSSTRGIGFLASL